MAKKESGKPTVTEFVLRRGKQPVLSHKDKAVCEARKASLQAADHANGVEHEYTVHERTVAYDGVDEIPTGEASHNVRGDVTETLVS